MATEPPPPRTGPNWLWITLIALLAILLIVWLLNPSGDTDDAMVEDPIVMPDPAAPDAGATGAALPGAGATEPVAGEPGSGSEATDRLRARDAEPIRGATETEPHPPPTQ